MAERQRAIGIFHSPLDTEAALRELDNSHFSLDRVFVIARNIDRENKIVGTELGESLRDRFDSRISSVTENSNLVEGETISLTKALIHLDIPTDAAVFYSNLVAKDKYLVMVEGSTADLLGAETILKRCGIQDWVIYKIILEHPEVIVVDRRTHHS